LAAPWFVDAALGLEVLFTFYVGNNPFLLARLRVSAGGGLDGMAMRELPGRIRVAAIRRAAGPRGLEHPPRRDTTLAADEDAYLVGPYAELLEVLRHDREGEQAPVAGAPGAALRRGSRGSAAGRGCAPRSCSRAVRSSGMGCRAVPPRGAPSPESRPAPVRARPRCHVAWRCRRYRGFVRPPRVSPRRPPRPLPRRQRPPRPPRSRPADPPAPAASSGSGRAARRRRSWHTRARSAAPAWTTSPRPLSPAPAPGRRPARAWRRALAWPWRRSARRLPWSRAGTGWCAPPLRAAACRPPRGSRRRARTRARSAPSTPRCGRVR